MTEDHSRVSIGRTEHGLTTITAKFKGGAASFVLDTESLTLEEFVEELRKLTKAIEPNLREKPCPK